MPRRDLLRSLVERLPWMVAYWDASRRCRFANRAYERWFGAPPEGLIGKHLCDLLGPLYAPNLPHIEGVLRGEPQEFEREIPDPSGGPPRHSLAEYIPDVFGGVVRGFFVLVTDVSALKRADLALRESEERFRLTIDEAPIGMGLVAPDGRFLRVNHAFCELVGYSVEELLALTFQDITHPDDVGTDLALVGRLARGEIPRYELEKRYLHKDGSTVDVMLHASAVRDADGRPRYFIGQIEDVTERKRLQDELRLAEAVSSGIISISADAIISIDRDLRITQFNEGAARIFGHAQADMIGAPLDLLLPERLRERHRAHIARFAGEGAGSRRMGRQNETIIGLRKDGREFRADAAISRLEVGGEVVLTVALRDVSEAKRLEGEQRFLAEVGPVLAGSLDYDETLRQVAALAVENIADVCIVDVVDPRGEETLLRLEVACRDPAKRAAGDALMNVQVDRRRPYLLGEVIRTGRPVLLQRPSAELLASLAQSEEHLRALRGLEIASMVAVPLVARARLLGAIALIRSSGDSPYGASDVRLAGELASRAALAIESARLYGAARQATRDRDDILGIVAHDLRNPLHNIVLQAELLRRRTDETDRGARRSAAMIERAARRMNRLIQDLLDVAKMEAGRLSVEPAKLATRDLVREAAEVQQAIAASKSVELRLDLAASLPELWADRDRLLQVFENLIGNAIKFSSHDATIVVGAAPRDRDVLFWVADTGPGIPAAYLPHVFDRFWQARKAGAEGAGLGLPIAKGVIEAHGGRIWLTSTLGRGTTFFFTLPTPDGDTAHPVD